MSIIPFESKNGVLTTYNFNRQVVDLSPYSFIKSIASTAFFNVTELRELILPDSLKCIEERAFQRCPKLEKIVFPKSLTEIKANPFEGTAWHKKQIKSNGIVMVNNILIDVKTALLFSDSLFETVERINSTAFNSQFQMKTVDLQKAKNLKTLESYSFYNCFNVETVYFNEDSPLKELQYGTFACCERLKEVVLPKNIEDINACAFSTSPWYNEHLVDGEYSSLLIYKDMLISDSSVPKSITKSIIRRDKDKAVILPEKKELDLNLYAPDIKTICSGSFLYGDYTKIILPKGLKRINYAAFVYCTNLKEIVIPENIEYIGDYAFSDCQNLNFNVYDLPINAAVSANAFDDFVSSKSIFEE